MVKKLQKVFFGKDREHLKSRWKLLVNKPSKNWNSFFLSKSNSWVSVNSSDISYDQFSSSTSSCPQDLGYDLSFISEEIETLDEIINHGLQCITRDLLQNMLALKDKRVTDHLQNMLTPGLGLMTIYLLWWQIKIRRMIVSAINL